MIPGFGADAGLHAALSRPDRADPPRRPVREGRRGLGRVLGGGGEPARAGLLSPVVRGRARRGARQRRLRIRRRLGARALPLSRQALGGRAGRPAFRAPYRGGGHHAHHPLRAKRLDRAHPRAPGRAGRLYAARRRPRPHLHRAAVRGAHAPARAGGPGCGGRGGGRQPGREPCADLRARARPGALARADDRLRARLRARRRRVRIGGLHLGQPADAHRDRAAADRHPARAVRLRRRHRDRGRRCSEPPSSCCSRSTPSRAGASGARAPEGNRNGQRIDPGDRPRPGAPRALSRRAPAGARGADRDRHRLPGPPARAPARHRLRRGLLAGARGLRRRDQRAGRALRDRSHLAGRRDLRAAERRRSAWRPPGRSRSSSSAARAR